jgi:phage terminase small subunit
LEKHELAFEDYKNGMKQKEIAKKYNTTINTVKSWSRRYEWSKKKKKGAPQNKSVHTKKECKKIAEKIVETSLDEEHQLFCIYYLKYHNKVKAYLKVKPKAKYNSACVMASRWFKKPEIQEEIKRLKQELYTDILLDPNDIVQRYIDIAFLDSDELDGKAIKMSDSLRALEWLSKHMNMANEEQRAKIDLIKAQTRKITIDDEQEEIIDDGFLEALNASAKEDWEDEED